MPCRREAASSPRRPDSSPGEAVDHRRWNRWRAQNSPKRIGDTGNRIPERASDRVPILRVNAGQSSSSVNGEIAAGSDSGIRLLSIYLPVRTPASGRGNPAKTTGKLVVAACADDEKMWNGKSISPTDLRPRTLRHTSASNCRAPGFFPGTGPEGQVSIDEWLAFSGPWSGQAWILHRSNPL